jgi:hypothetical protein
MGTTAAIAIIFFLAGWFVGLRYYQARQRRIKLEEKRRREREIRDDRAD